MELLLEEIVWWFFLMFLMEKLSYFPLKEYSGHKRLKRPLLGSVEVLSKGAWTMSLLHFLLLSALFRGSSPWHTRTNLCIPARTTESQSKLVL